MNTENENRGFCPIHNCPPHACPLDCPNNNVAEQVDKSLHSTGPVADFFVQAEPLKDNIEEVILRDIETGQLAFKQLSEE